MAAVGLQGVVVAAKTKIAITGPSGSGKSAVAEMLRKKGYSVIDADKISKSIKPEYEAKIIELFGEEIVSEGHLDNKKLASLIFDNFSAKSKLNDLMFPPILAKVKELMDKESGIVFVDIPVLFQSGAVSLFDKIIIITAKPEVRLKRLIEGRNIDPEIAAKQIYSINITYDDAAKADAVLWNEEPTLDHIEQRIDLMIGAKS